MTIHFDGGVLMDARTPSAGGKDRGPLPVGLHSVNGVEISAVKTDFRIVLSQMIRGAERICRLIDNLYLALAGL
ncbi:hypothetical protein RAD15_12965 [Bradyrhizobium sp. 14AA]